MGTLYLDRRDLELRAEKGAVVIYDGGVRARTVPLALLDRVVVSADAVLRARLVGQLAEAGIGLLVLHPRRPERAAILLGRPHADVRLRLAQYQLCFATGHASGAGRGAAGTPAREEAGNPAAPAAAWARSLVAAKIAAQRRVLARALALRGETNPAPAARDGLAALATIAARLAGPGDLAPAVLLGLEGSAAAAHFAALTGLFPPALGFLRRNRRPPRDPVNACLSLAYTLLHADAVAQAHQAGLDPLLGFYHAPAYGRESLASDLIEPLRPRADFWVWQLFRRRDLRLDHFACEGGACLLGKTGRRVFYQAFEGQAPVWRRWLRRACYALAAALRTAETPRLLSRWEGAWEDEP